MFRRLKRGGITSRVTKSATKAQTIVKQVRHLPGGQAAGKAATAKRLAQLESVPFVNSDISAELHVQRRISERLNARAVEKHVPAVKLFSGRNQREGRASQLRGAA